MENSARKGSKLLTAHLQRFETYFNLTCGMNDVMLAVLYFFEQRPDFNFNPNLRTAGSQKNNFGVHFSCSLIGTQDSCEGRADATTVLYCILFVLKHS